MWELRLQRRSGVLAGLRRKKEASAASKAARTRAREQGRHWEAHQLREPASARWERKEASRLHIGRSIKEAISCLMSHNKYAFIEFYLIFPLRRAQYYLRILQTLFYWWMFLIPYYSVVMVSPKETRYTRRRRRRARSPYNRIRLSVFRSALKRRRMWIVERCIQWCGFLLEKQAADCERR